MSNQGQGMHKNKAAKGQWRERNSGFRTQPFPEEIVIHYQAE